MSDSLRPHESQHARPPCPSPTPRVHSNAWPLSWWCHPAISSSVVPFSSCPNPSQHQSLFQWVKSLHELAKVLEWEGEKNLALVVCFILLLKKDIKKVLSLAAYFLRSLAFLPVTLSAGMLKLLHNVILSLCWYGLQSCQEPMCILSCLFIISTIIDHSHVSKQLAITSAFQQ